MTIKKDLKMMARLTVSCNYPDVVNYICFASFFDLFHCIESKLSITAMLHTGNHTIAPFRDPH